MMTIKEELVNKLRLTVSPRTRSCISNIFSFVFNLPIPKICTRSPQKLMTVYIALMREVGFLLSVPGLVLHWRRLPG